MRIGIGGSPVWPLDCFCGKNMGRFADGNWLPLENSAAIRTFPIGSSSKPSIFWESDTAKMPSTEKWWTGSINWETPAGVLLDRFLSTLPLDRPISLTLYGSAPLQLTVDGSLMSGDVDLFSDDGEDISHFIQAAKLDKASSGFYLEPGYELSFRTSPRWRQRALQVHRRSAILTIPHPIDILIGKLNRLESKDMEAFRRVIRLTGHPTADELQKELQEAVDLFRPGFEEESPNLFPDNTRKLWRELFGREIDIRADIIAPAVTRRNLTYPNPPDYKSKLGE